MNNDGTNMGGFLTNYLLIFTTSKYLRPNSWLRLEFPTEYVTFGNTECVFKTLNGLIMTCIGYIKKLFIYLFINK